MVIVDTTVWVDYLADRDTPHVRWLHRQMAIELIGLNDLILCEVLQGIRGDEIFRQTQSDLSRFVVHAGTTPEIAIASANHYRLLRSKGITVRKTIDCLIATFCIAGNHRLLHHDRDFDAFEAFLGLKVIHPIQPELAIS